MWKSISLSPLLKKTTAASLALALAAGSMAALPADAKPKSPKGHLDPKGHGVKKQQEITINLHFYDLDPEDWAWAYEHIIRLASKQVFNGYTDGTFKPNKTISRIEALVAAVRLLGLKEEAEKPENMNANLNFRDFDHVKKKYPWAVGYVTVALENDLFAETETHVHPDKPADRLWASVLLVKALGLEDEAKKKMDADLPFRDEREIPAGSVGYVAVALEKGLITGYHDNTFRPHKPVTRAELAALLDRADEQLPDDEKNGTVQGMIQAVANTGITVKKADGTVVTYPFAKDVFIFRDNVKANPGALKVGDEVRIQVFQGAVIFIEVTKTAQTNVQFTDSGKVNVYTLNAQGKIATISLVKEVNGVSQTVVYNVADNVVIEGGNGALSPGLNVVVSGVNNVVTKIVIQP